MQVARTQPQITEATLPATEDSAPVEGETSEPKKEPTASEALQELVAGIVGSGGSDKPLLLVFYSSESGPNEKKPLPAFVLGKDLLAQFTSPSVDINLGLALKNQFSVRKVAVSPSSDGQRFALCGLKQFPAMVIVDPAGKVIDSKALSGKMPDAAIFSWLSGGCKTMGLELMGKVKAHAEILAKIISLDGKIKSTQTSAGSAKGKAKEKFEEQVAKLKEDMAALVAKEQTIWVATEAVAD